MIYFDENKLRQKYIQTPLKYGQAIPRNELEYLFLELNLAQHQCAEVFNCCIPKVTKWLRRYNITKPTHLISERRKQTFREVYGVEHALQRKESMEKFKKTCLKKYGCDNYNKTDICKQQKVKTMQMRYGVDNPCHLPDYQQKYKVTCLKRFGVDNPSKLPETIKKIDDTKTKNHTHQTSSEEDKIYEYLKHKYQKVFRNYKTDQYPWKCDFYIEEENLYIEYQGFWTHGPCPYNKENLSHQEKVNYWENKATEVNIHGDKKLVYLEAIKTWTETDPNKREWVKTHNLKWIEFFSINEFLNWFNS